jgi:hypothetical protein
MVAECLANLGQTFGKSGHQRCPALDNESARLVRGGREGGHRQWALVKMPARLAWISSRLRMWEILSLAASEPMDEPPRADRGRFDRIASQSHRERQKARPARPGGAQASA